METGCVIFCVTNDKAFSSIATEGLKHHLKLGTLSLEIKYIAMSLFLQHRLHAKFQFIAVDLLVML
jgi:hypothetical protein